MRVSDCCKEAVETKNALQDNEQFLDAQGEHPKHRGVSDPGLLGTVERFFAEIMVIPRLQQRIDCFIFIRSFEPAMQRVMIPHSLHLDAGTEAKVISVGPATQHVNVYCNFPAHSH